MPSKQQHLNEARQLASDAGMSQADFDRQQLRYLKILPDEQIDAAWGSANFGSRGRRDVIKDTLVKVLAGYDTGRTAKVICRELGLIHPRKWMLTVKGRKYIGEYLLEYINTQP